MTKVTRRNFLKSGTALAGGMAGILATGRAPAFAQGTTVHWLRWNDFVPASDQLLRKEMLPEAEKALGLQSRLDHAQQQSPAALCGELRRHDGCRRAARQGRGRALSAREGELE